MALKLIKRGDDLRSETAFEEAFANLAFAVQNDAIPRLAKHILGFQLLEKSEDERRAVGIIGLQLGSILAYAPFFFHNGEMFGNELLWLVKSDTFVPKTDAWIDYLLGLGSRSLGKPITYETARKNIGAPDLTPFRSITVKTSATALASWMSPGYAGIYAAADPTDGGLYSGIDLRRAISSPPLAAALTRIVEQHPRVGTYVSRFYGPGLLKRAKAIAKNAYSTVFAGLPTLSTPWILPPTHRSDLRIYTDVDLDDGSLKPIERIQLLKKGYYIKDLRKTHSKVAVYNEVKKELEQTLITPARTGIYDILRNDGSFIRCLVIDGRYYFYPADSPKEVVEIAEPPVCCRSISQHHADKPIGQPVNVSDEVAYDAAMSLEDALQASHAFAREDSFNGEAPAARTATILVGDKYGNWVEVCITVRGNISRRNEWEMSLDKARLPVAFGGEDTNRILKLPGLVVIPPNARALPLCPHHDRRRLSSGALSGNFLFTDKAVTPKALNNNGNDNNKSASVAKSFPYTQLQIVSNDTDAWLNGRRFSKKAALFSLVSDYGLSERDAIKMLKAAYRNRTTYLIKRAQVTGTAPTMPFPPEPVPSVDPVFGVPAVTREVHSITPGSAHLSAPVVPYDAPLNNPVDPQLINAVTQAARTGQKEVFDTSIMSAMLASTDVFDVVEKHVPKLLKGIDAIGRLLFNLYWHKNAFEKRLGKYDLAKLRDTLRSVFTQLGDAAVALREKATAGSGQDIQDVLEQQREEMT